VNFAELLDVAADRSPLGEAIRQDGRALAYDELRARALSVTGLVQRIGRGRDDKIAVLMHNSFEYAEIAFGIMGGGCVLLPINPRLAAAEIRYVVDNADVRAIFIGPEFVDTYRSIQADLTNVEHVFVVSDQLADADAAPGAGWYSYASMLSAAESATSWADTSDDDDCMLVYTSGTTGSPKGAVRTHSSAMWGASNFSAVWGEIDPEHDRFLYCIPMASIGFLNVFASSVFNGLTVELMYRFAPEAALRLIEANQVTHAYLVPAMWRMVMRSAELGDRDLSSLRSGIWGGEPLDDALRDAIIARFGRVLLGVFGTTEGALLSSRLGDDERYPKTSGRAAGYNRFRVIDEEGHDVSRGTVGELINKSPTTLSRYYKNPEATAEVLVDGWYHTGDLAWMNDDGFVFVVDRKREMLIAGGQNVYPAELERVLCDHSGVAAAAVIGVPDADWGEAAMAFIVPAAEAPAVEDLVAHMRANLARYKVPRHWRFVEELPTNSMGKVRKHALRELLEEAR
jgi:fatty-acyl-CoA synthase